MTENVNTNNYFLSQISDGGIGSGTPLSNPPSNIKVNYALGYFSAYTIKKKLR